MIEGIDLEINDLFDDDNDDDHGKEREDGDENKNKGETSAVEVKPRRVVRNPQPKLNPERLGGSRGLVQLPKIFSEVRLKGEGHEKENLDVVMKTLEHWSYRLFPRFPFDDVLEKIEKLGAKKQVQTCLKKIRLDMLVDDDYVEVPVEDADNDMDGARANRLDSPLPNPQSNDELFDNIFTKHTAPPVPIDSQSTPTPVDTTSSVLTDKQIEKIEQNRRLAMERRATKLQHMTTEQPEADFVSFQMEENEDKQTEDNQDREKATNEMEKGEKTNEVEMLNEDELLAFLDNDL